MTPRSGTQEPLLSGHRGRKQAEVFTCRSCVQSSRMSFSHACSCSPMSCKPCKVQTRSKRAHTHKNDRQLSHAKQTNKQTNKQRKKRTLMHTARGGGARHAKQTIKQTSKKEKKEKDTQMHTARGGGALPTFLSSASCLAALGARGK